MSALSAGSVSLPVRPDAQGFGTALRGQIMGDGIMLGIGATIGNQIVRGIEGTIRTATRAITEVISTGLQETLDASAGIAQLNAGIVSTGNVANVTVQGMEDLASSIQKVSGQTDDSIVAAQSLLLTFTNIRNVGADKIFDAATQAAADMAAKFGGDASSQAVLLGKALNDPVRGITALQRAGVSFTQSQRDQIEALVDAGDVLSAQKIILQELQVEFGGAAAAAGESLPGGLQRLKRSFEDLSQSLVEGSLGTVLGTVFGSMTTTLQAVQDSPGFAVLVQNLTALGDRAAADIQGAFDSILMVMQSDTDTPLTDLLTLLVNSSPSLRFVSEVFSRLGPTLPAVQDAFVQIGAALAEVLPKLADASVELLPALLQVVVALLPVIDPLADILISIAPAIADITEALVPFISITVGLTTYLAGIVTGFSNGEMSLRKFIDLINDSARLMLPALNAILSIVEGVVNGAIDAINGLAGIIPGFLSMIGDALGFDVKVGYWKLQHINVTLIDPTAGTTGVAGSSGGMKRAAAGGTFEPRPGGHIVNLAEAGRAETVVDTATLQAAMAQRGNTQNITVYEATNANATAMQVIRRLNAGMAS